jgi:N6-L-threonylcarbamoyladenine synthase
MHFLGGELDPRVVTFVPNLLVRRLSQCWRQQLSQQVVVASARPLRRDPGSKRGARALVRSYRARLEMSSEAEAQRQDRTRIGEPKGIDYGEYARSEQALRLRKVSVTEPDSGNSAEAVKRVLRMPLPSHRGLSLTLPVRATEGATGLESSLGARDRGARPYLVLGIETSCDDTAVAVVSSEGRILAEAVMKQDRIHARFGGVVPGLARQAHEQVIDELIQRVLCDAFCCSPEDVWRHSAHQLDAVAVTMGPGLEICLRVGFHAARRLLGRLTSSAPGLEPMFISTHHLESHCLVPRLFGLYQPVFPFLVLLVSGGHCMLLLARDLGSYHVIGSTLDDSVGEAFDKIARLLGLEVGGGGGPALEHLAREGNPFAFDFPVPLKKRRDCNFSFAGLKTAVRLAIENEIKQRGADIETISLLQMNRQVAADIAASFQRVSLEHLFERTRRALLWCRSHEPRVQSLMVSGGVAANRELRKRFGELASELGWRLHDEENEHPESLRPLLNSSPNALSHSIIFPPLRFCTDNGVMVAWAGIERLQRLGDAAREPQPDSLEVVARWPIGQRLVMDSSENTVLA